MYNNIFFFKLDYLFKKIEVKKQNTSLVFTQNGKVFHFFASS